MISPRRLTIGDRLARTQVVEAAQLAFVQRSIRKSRWKQVATVVVTGGGVWVTMCVLPVTSNMREARVQQAKTEVRTLGNCLEIHRRIFGRDPSPGEGLLALRAPRVCGEHMPLVDPWGHPYVYACPGRSGPNACDLLSYGADGRPGGVDHNQDIPVLKDTGAQ